MEIYRAPIYLIIHFKRFKKNGIDLSKNSCFIDFPIHNLDLSEYISEKEPPNYYFNHLSENIRIMPYYITQKKVE